MPEPTPDADADADADAVAEELPEPFANRAARRAKGKPTANHAVGAEGRRPVRSGTVQTPRQYGNRRSG